MRTSPRRWPPRSTRCGRSRPASSSASSAAAATATRASGRSWARSRSSKADVVIVTDDNPRSEQPERDPRRDPGRRARRARDRRPGRGHPRRRRHDGRRATWCWSRARATKPARSSATGVPFSDHEAVRRHWRSSRRHRCDAALELATSSCARPAAAADGAPARADHGLLHRHAHACSRATCSWRLKDQRDGHEFVLEALRGRRGGGARRRRATSARPATARLLRVADTLKALEASARGRARGSQPTRASSPSRAAPARPAPRRCCAPACRGVGRDACVGKILQQPLGRAADAGAHAGATRSSACSRSA